MKWLKTVDSICCRFHSLFILVPYGSARERSYCGLVYANELSLCYHGREDLGIFLKSHDPFCLIDETNGIQWVTSAKFMPKSTAKLLLKFCRDSSLRMTFMDLYVEFKKAFSNNDRWSYSLVLWLALHNQQLFWTLSCLKAESFYYLSPRSWLMLCDHLLETGTHYQSPTVG